MLIFILSVVLLGIAFAFLGIKMFFKKGGEFKKHCASIEMEDGEHISCASCKGVEKHETCSNYELHHGNISSQSKKAADMVE